MWFGKIFGSTMGFFTGGPIGAMLGMALGNKFDEQFGEALKHGFGFSVTGATLSPIERETFHTALFISLGYIAKSGGKVYPEDIQFAERVMLHLRLSDEESVAAKQAFNLGKSGAPDIESRIRQLRQPAFYHSPQVQLYLGALLEATYSRNEASAAREQACKLLCRHIGVAEYQFEQLKLTYLRQQIRPERVDTHSLARASQTLGVPRGASQADIKQAYRRLMSQHHPDKLHARGGNAQQLHQAKEKSQQIRAAYDLLKSQTSE